MVGVERMMRCVGEVQKAFPRLAVIGSGFSYMGKESENLAAGAVNDGVCTLAGFGREAFAYPEFARDIFAGGMDEKKICIAWRQMHRTDARRKQGRLRHPRQQRLYAVVP